MPDFMRALVTGGAGFIGSNLVDALARARRRGDRARQPLDRQAREPRAGARPAAPSSPRSTSATPRPSSALVERAQPEVDLPPRRRRSTCASRSPTRPTTRASTWSARSTCSSAAQRAGVRRVVNTSTGGAIYGEGQIVPAPEDHPVAPEAPYGLSKFCAESYCDLFTPPARRCPRSSLRYGNVYGPRQDPLGEAGVIAIFCGGLLEGGRPRCSATASRRATTCYVGDVVSANLARRRVRRRRRVQHRHRRADDA